MATQEPFIVELRHIVKEYRLGETVVPALGGVDLALRRAEFAALAGPSGSGKSTLLNIIGCIERPTTGEVRVNGVDASWASDNQLSDLRANAIGFVFQNFNLIPVLSAFENVEYPLHKKRLPADERAARVTGALRDVGLEKFANHKPMELSGGQRQRVAIARALVGRPALILADEPTANLDHKTGEGILDLLKEINASTGATIVLSTHDPLVMKRASRLVNLWDGKVEAAS